MGQIVHEYGQYVIEKEEVSFHGGSRHCYFLDECLGPKRKQITAGSFAHCKKALERIQELEENKLPVYSYKVDRRKVEQ